MTRNMAHSVMELDGQIVFLSLHTKNVPSDEEWKGWTDTLEVHGRECGWNLGRSSNLVLTDGGAPTIGQRTAVNTLVAQGKTPPWVAVVTESTFVRAMLRALSIFNPRVHAFAPKDARAATDHLQLRSADALEKVVEACERLERQTFGAGTIQTLREVARATPR